MTLANQQNAVFNRTKRIEIPSSFVERSVDSGRILFKCLRRGAWSELIEPQALADAVLYIDIHSLLLWKRETISDPRQVFEPGWKGCSVDVPKELTNNDHRVRLQITIAFPSNHEDAGRIIARTDELIVVEGPDQPGGSTGSLLPVSPTIDHIPELARLAISESDGKIFAVVCMHGGFSPCALGSLAARTS